MTIRSGGSPRDNEASDVDQAHLPDDDVWTPLRAAPSATTAIAAASRNGRGGGLPGLLKFLAFALVMATVVMIGLLTLLRPFLAGAIVDWAYDSPSALALPFVKDLVKEDLGHAPHDRPERGHDRAGVRHRQGRHGGGDRRSPGGRRLPARCPGVRLHGDRPQHRRQAGDGHLHPAQEHDPRPARHGPPPGEGPGRRPGVPRGPPARADGRQARDAAGHDGRRRLLRPRQAPDAGDPRQAPMARPAEGRVARGVPGPGGLPRPAGHHARAARQQDARHVLPPGRRGPGERPQEPRDDVLPGRHARLARRARGQARHGAPAHRRRVPEPAQPQALPARRVPVGRDDLLHPRLAPAGQDAPRPVDRVLVLGTGRREAHRRHDPGGPQGVRHVLEQGPDARADLHAEPGLDRRRPQARTRRPATCSSWPRTTGRTRRRSRRPRPSTTRTSRSTPSDRRYAR